MEELDIHTPVTSELLLTATQIALDTCDSKCEVLRASARRFQKFLGKHHKRLIRQKLSLARCPCHPTDWCDWSPQALSSLIVERKLLENPAIYLEDLSGNRVAEAKLVPEPSVGMYDLYRMEWGPDVDYTQLDSVHYFISGTVDEQPVNRRLPVRIIR